MPSNSASHKCRLLIDILQFLEEGDKVGHVSYEAALDTSLNVRYSSRITLVPLALDSIRRKFELGDVWLQK